MDKNLILCNLAKNIEFVKLKKSIWRLLFVLLCLAAVVWYIQKKTVREGISSMLMELREELVHHLSEPDLQESVMKAYRSQQTAGSEAFENMEHASDELDYFLADKGQIVFWTASGAYPFTDQLNGIVDSTFYLYADGELYMIVGSRMSQDSTLGLYVRRRIAGTQDGSVHKRDLPFDIVDRGSTHRIVDINQVSVGLVQRDTGKLPDLMHFVLLVMFGVLYLAVFAEIRRVKGKNKKLFRYSGLFLVHGFIVYLVFKVLLDLEVYFLWSIGLNVVFWFLSVASTKWWYKPKSDKGAMLVGMAYILAQCSILLFLVCFIKLMASKGLLVFDPNEHLGFQVGSLIQFFLPVSLGLSATPLLLWLSEGFRTVSRSVRSNVAGFLVILILCGLVYLLGPGEVDRIILFMGLGIVLWINFFPVSKPNSYLWMIVWLCIASIFLAHIIQNYGQGAEGDFSRPGVYTVGIFSIFSVVFLMSNVLVLFFLGMGNILQNVPVVYQMFKGIRRTFRFKIQTTIVSFVFLSLTLCLIFAFYYFLAENDQSVQEQSVYIDKMLNGYVLLLITLGSLSLWFAGQITKPIQVLGDNLKNLKSGKVQKLMSSWAKEDELGALIQDYNNTVNNLEESAKLLAITERESAWREMAKQVAHEIKNPLTPMKLSIQHLQMVSNRVENEEIKKKIHRVCNTLIEQIEGLANIAGEFSSFAHFPKPQNQSIVLNEVIATAHDLFRKRDDMTINLYVPIDDIIVFADKNALLRLFNNLLKNAIQSIPVGRKGRINISLETKDRYALIKIEDNGCGIPDDMYDKIFKPNFTTKSSGTGLGLAISTNVIQSLNGRIYFETKLNEGTAFFVEIPLMHKEENFDNPIRVEL